ncbi:MAG: lipopolysaccharide heptosyltransferase II [Burkholderiaceae bacterium]
MSARALVIAPNWIGDAVMAQPLLALLRQRAPQLRIDAVCGPHIAPVFRAMAEVDEVVEAVNKHGRLDLGARWRLAGQLRQRRYDSAYVLPNSAKSALVPWLARIPERIGHRGEARHLLLNRLHDGEAAKRRPMVEHYAQLAFDPKLPLPGKVPDPRLQRSDEREAAVRRKFGFEPGAPLLVLCPGAEYGPAKRWPARHFAALASLAAAEWPEADIVLLGSAKERGIATEITALSGQPLRNLCGDTSLDEAIAIVSQASGVVSNDSGLMHLAAAFGRPQVAVFGSSDPRHTPPRSPRARIEWLHLECSPCFKRECPLGHLDCLNRVRPEAVFDSLKQAMRFETSSIRPAR